MLALASPPPVSRRELTQVRRAARRVAVARDDFLRAILAAHRSGESYRTIAEYAGLSHSRVAELVQEAREREQEL